MRQIATILLALCVAGCQDETECSPYYMVNGPLCIPYSDAALGNWQIQTMTCTAGTINYVGQTWQSESKGPNSFRLGEVLYTMDQPDTFTGEPITVVVGGLEWTVLSTGTIDRVANTMALHEVWSIPTYSFTCDLVLGRQ